jgi:predicted CDP-diglyceride synthetase/phosphatidate cytidylyltransferase
MKFGWFAYLNKPLDFGKRIAKTDIFGPNKNWRGAVIYIIGGTLVTYLLHLLLPTQPWIAAVFGSDPLLLGITTCLAYVLGELINSFIKRRLGITPGSAGNLLQKFIDNSDGALATGVIYLFVFGVSLNLLMAAFVISLVVHASTDVLMRRLRLKSK